jgi:hypothetical protein
MWLPTTQFFACRNFFLSKTPKDPKRHGNRGLVDVVTHNPIFFLRVTTRVSTFLPHARPNLNRFPVIERIQN